MILKVKTSVTALYLMGESIVISIQIDTIPGITKELKTE